MSIYIVDVVKLDEIEESFTVDFVMEMRWRDERLSASKRGTSLEACVLRLDEIWHPELVIINKRSVKKERPDLVHVDAEGNAEYKQRFYGNLGSPLELESFPFDRQALAIRMGTSYDIEEVQIVADLDRTSVYPMAELPSWTIESFHSEVKSEPLPGPQMTVSVFSSVLTVRRHLGPYLWRIFLPLTLIGLMAWTVFWIDPKNFGPQVVVSTSSIFTLIAFLLGLRQGLPRISYLTKADQLVLTATVLVFAALAGAIATAYLTQSGKSELALRIDRHARWVYPTLAVLSSILIVAT